MSVQPSPLREGFPHSEGLPLREGASRSTLHVIVLCTVLGFLAVTAGILLLTTLLRADFSDERSVGITLILALLLLVFAISLEALMFVPFAAYLRKKRFRLLSFAGFTNPGAGVGWLSVAAAVLLFVVNIALINVFTPLFQLAGIAPLPTTEPVFPSDQLFSYIFAVLIEVALLASVPAVIEEFIFRGVLFRTLGASWRTVWVSAVLFALMHVDAVTLPSKLAMGIALAAVFFLTRSLWTAVIMHFANNALAVFTDRLIPMVSIHDASWQLEVAVWAGIAVVSAAALAALLFAMKKVRQRRELSLRRRMEGIAPVEKLGFEKTYVEPPLVDSFGKGKVLKYPLWVAGGVLAAATALVAVAGYFHWFGNAG